MFRGPYRVADKVVLLVLALELVSILLWGSLTYQASREELLRSISRQLSEAAVSTTSTIGNFFVPLHVESNVLADNLQSDLIPLAQKRILLYRLIKRRPEIDELDLVTNNGEELMRVSRVHSFGQAQLRDLTRDPLYHEARAGHTVSGPVTFTRYFEPQMRLATPVGVAAGRHAALIMHVNLKWLWDAVQALRIGKSGYVYIVDKDLKLVAYPDPSFVLGEGQVTGKGIPEILFHDHGERRLQVYTSLSGKQVAGVSRFDPVHQWWVVVEQPVKEGLAPLQRLIQRFVVTFLLAALLTTFIVFFFAHRMLRPLAVLQRGIARLAHGQRKVRIAVPQNTELATLAEGFNRMAEHLDEHIAGLVEAQARERSSREALASSERRVRLLLESTAEGIFGLDSHGCCSFCNPALLRQLGYDHVEQVLGQELCTLMQPTDNDGAPLSEAQCPFTRLEQMAQGLHLPDIQLTRRDGSRFHAECWVRPVREDGAYLGAVVSVLDVSERHHHTRELEYQATHDSLTQLPNRHLLLRQLDLALGEHLANAGTVTLFIIDLDRFKEVNDTLGHKSGDLLLKQLGKRLSSLLDEGDVLARLGGDEFAVLLRWIGGAEQAIEKAILMRSAIQLPFELDGMRVQIDASIGVAQAPVHGDNASELMRYADVAMYLAKHSGEGCVLYDPSHDAHSPRRLALMSDLGRAITDDELLLHYQPKIGLRDHRVIGVEALVRWQHGEYGLLGPDQFVPLAELGEHIKPMTLWVIERALRDWQHWREQGITLTVGVNISVRNLQDRDFADKVAMLLERYGHGAGTGRGYRCLQFEITESAIMTDPTRAMATMEALNALGIDLLIDDFGTGYSSLTHLKRLNVDVLKIDKSFVMEMEHNDNDAVIVRSTIELAHSLGLTVTAEGVETRAALDMLTALGCDTAQGYHICRPLPSVALLPWLRQWRESRVQDLS